MQFARPHGCRSHTPMGCHTAIQQHVQYKAPKTQYNRLNRFSSNPLLKLRATEGTGSIEFELAAPLSSPQGSQLAQILSSGEANDRVLFDPAVKTYLQELQQEREMEAAMEAEAAADAAADATGTPDPARASSGVDSTERNSSSSSSNAADSEAQIEVSSSSSEAYDAAATWDDTALMKRIRAVREAERGQVVADIVYLQVARSLLSEGLQLLNNVSLLSPAISQPPGSFVSQQKLSRSSLLSPAVADAVLSYMASTFEGGDGELMKVASPAATPLSVDRVQAARLYAGLLEFGYFAAALEAACAAAEVPLGSDSTALIAFADKLPEGQLRSMCAVQSADGWWSAVRHIGCVFGLTPNQDPFDSFGLPYPDLALTISQIRMEPAANMWEHFNTPGSAARLAAKTADKMARGWSGAEADGALPDADLLAFEFGLFQRLLLEAAVYGGVLFGVEQHLEKVYSYKLGSRREREEQADQPPL